jgi:hypothetical protein
MLTGAPPQVLIIVTSTTNPPRYTDTSNLQRHVSLEAPATGVGPSPKNDFVSNLSFVSSLLWLPRVSLYIKPGYRVRLQHITYPLITSLIIRLVHIFATYYNRADSRALRRPARLDPELQRPVQIRRRGMPSSPLS